MMGHKKPVLFICVLCVVLGTTADRSFAAAIDILVNKLVDKGVLTEEEGQQIIAETKEEIQKQWENAAVAGVPKWIQKMKVKGDLRLRFQWHDMTDTRDRHRARYRFRLGAETKLRKDLKVAAGIASGSSDPRSANQTMDNTFQTPDLRLDYAYAEWKPRKCMILRGGKLHGVKKQIFRPSDLLFDSDINPEGASILLHKKINGHLELFCNGGIWVLDEIAGTNADPFMAYAQPGFKFKFCDRVHVKTACTYYAFDNLQGKVLPFSSGTNTINPQTGGYRYDYDAVASSVELGIVDPFNGIVPYLAFFGDMVYNTTPHDNNMGYLAGLKFGAKKVKKFGDWQMRYSYRHLETDAWPDALPDSDAMGGGTDALAHEVGFIYGVTKNVFAEFDYYYARRIQARDAKNHLFQADLNFKF